MKVSELPEELYSDIQVIFRATPVLLVGSGFSCGYGLPHMGALGEHLTSVVGPRLASAEAQAAWAGALDAISTNLEGGLNTISLGAKGRDEIVAILREETAKLITEATWAAERTILAHANPKDHAPARLLRRLFDGASQNAESLPVITTNYDTLLELFCDLAELPLDTGFTGFRRRKPRNNPLFSTHYNRVWATDRRSGMQPDHRPCRTVRLHKPHGSITWITTEDGPIEVVNDTSDAPKAIVVPGPSKYQDALVNTLFDAMRAEMNRAVESAGAVLCIGFGFNDDHLQGVINDRLEDGMPLIVITRGLTDSIRTVLARHPHVIAFSREGTGAVCHHDGESFFSSRPLWQLDDFLKEFLE